MFLIIDDDSESLSDKACCCSFHLFRLFLSVDDLGTKFTILIQGENPLTISDIVFFLLPGVFLPSGTGAVLYWMVEGTAGFETLGAIVPERPSGVFR